MTRPAPSGRPRPHPLAWVFVALAILDLAYFIANAHLDANPTLDIIGSYILQAVPYLAAVLLPVAILARHRDVAREARTLLAGTILFAIVSQLLIVSGPLEDRFRALTPPSADLPQLVASSAIYNALIGLLLATALFAITAGLGKLRRYEDRPGPLSVLFLAFMTVVGTAINVLAVMSMDFTDVQLSAGLVIYLVSAVFFPVLRFVAWAYLLAALARGWRDGERPKNGWLWGTVGAGLVIIAVVLVNLGAVLVTTGFDTQYVYATFITYALGHLVLLAAFAVGLPAFDWGEDEDDEEPAEVEPVPTVVRRRQLEGQRRRR